MVSSRGIEIDPSKVKAICELRPPSFVKEVRRLLGRLNYVARFISHPSETARPFFKLLKKNAKIVWDIECQTAFLKIQQYPTHSPVLVPPVPGVPLILYPTIHKESLGAILVQKRPSDGKECVIYYLSKKFFDSQANYSEVEKTCIALVWVLHRLRQYTLHHQIMLTTECDPIKYPLEKPALVGKLAKWQILISEFDVQTMTRKSVKGRAIVDMLAENAAGLQTGDEIDPLDDRVLLVTVEKWVMYFDGAVNLSGSGTGACAVEMKIRRLQVYGDSALIILQIEGKWKTRDPKLIPYHEFLEDIIEEFDEIAFEYLPRAQNPFADALATLSSMFQVTAGSDIEPLRIEILKHSAYSMPIDEEADGEPRYQDIKVYPQTGEFLEGSEAADRKYPMKLSSKFFLGGDTLYKRSYDSVLPRYVDAKEANQLMSEIHEGECGPHMNGHLPSKKIMRLGYYWLTLEADSSSYANVIAKNVAGFLRRDVFARYGAPEAIITDNGSNLNNKVVDEVLGEFRVRHLNSSPYRPQMNGVVEAANKNIKKIMSKTAENYRDWHERLPYTLMAYRISIRTSTGATPFLLAYGMEAVLPVETEIPSLGIQSRLKLSEAEWIQQRYEQLNMIDEKRLRAICHDQCYQKRVAKSFNRKVRPRVFEIGMGQFVKFQDALLAQILGRVNTKGQLVFAARIHPMR
ncbi:uncharacterized protein LOC125314571 [Rhodamnia argentea]|uniref:Uncharacterized protein LOC125314571 n=1 Tax=Rhodamnia argentea TaxID=178133 RepID=A0ABM3H908_9MYRT|nr:uncharacterized protein LOC125314571 [Rhodamnia argentea]